MPLYDKPPVGILLDVFTASNSGAKNPPVLNSANARCGLPIAVSGSPSWNTQVTIYAARSSNNLGKVTVKYRRLSLRTLFSSISVEIHVYSPAAANAVPYKFSDLLPLFNQKYGLNLTTDDFIDQSFPIASDTKYSSTVRNSVITLQANPNSLQYIDQINVRWVNAPPVLSDLIKTTVLPGRTYPGGNDFLSAHAYVLNIETFGYDFSSIATYVGTGVGFVSHAAPLIASLTGKPYTYDSQNQNAPFNLFGASYTVYALPNAAVPEANSTDYNHVAVMTLGAGDTWGVGALYLHYNT